MRYKAACPREGLLVALSAVLLGCAATPPAKPEPVAYRGSSVVPASFDMEVTPAADGRYKIGDKSLTLGQLQWKFREAKAAGTLIKNVLYHEIPPGTIMQFICYISLINDWDIDSFTDYQGKTRPSVLTADSAETFSMLTQQCNESLRQQ